jgi:hypothetical protein
MAKVALVTSFINPDSAAIAKFLLPKSHTRNTFDWHE